MNKMPTTPTTPILLGMNNPLSSSLSHALYPWPPLRRQSPSPAHGAQSLREALAGSGRTVLVLGQATWAALGLPKGAPLVLPITVQGTTYRRVPHPSGLSRLPAPDVHTNAAIDAALRGAPYTTPVLRPWEMDTVEAVEQALEKAGVPT